MTTDIRTDIPVDIHPSVLSQYQDVLGQNATVGASALNDGLGALTEIYSTLGKLNDAQVAWEAASPKTTRVVNGRATEVSLPSTELITAAERDEEKTEPTKSVKFDRESASKNDERLRRDEIESNRTTTKPLAPPVSSAYGTSVQPTPRPMRNSSWNPR